MVLNLYKMYINVYYGIIIIHNVNNIFIINAIYAFIFNIQTSNYKLFKLIIVRQK